MRVKTLPERAVILVCTENGCKKNGAKKVYDHLREYLEESGLSGRVRIQKTRCMGRCECGPNAMVYPAREMFSGIKV